MITVIIHVEFFGRSKGMRDFDPLFGKVAVSNRGALSPADDDGGEPRGKKMHTVVPFEETAGKTTRKRQQLCRRHPAHRGLRR